VESTSGQLPAQSISSPSHNGQPSQDQQSTSLTTTRGSTKPPSNREHFQGATTLERLVASFIVSLGHIGVLFPIILSVTTLVFFFYYDGLLQPLDHLLFSGDKDGGFLILIAGFLCACIITLIYAFCSAPFVTAANKGLQDYDELEVSERKLRPYFGIPASEQEIPAILEDDMIDRIRIPNLKQDTTKLDILTQAYTTYLALYKRLYFPKGGQLLSNRGDLSAWRMAYRTEEALTAIKTTPTILGEVLIDYSTIRGSTINDRNTLLEQLTRAVKNFDPKAREYLKDLESNKDFASMREYLQELLKDLETTDITSTSSPPLNQKEQTPKQKDTDISQLDSEAFARTTIRSVKERLHVFQENRLAGILQARKNLILATVASGFMAYAFLFLGILSIPTNTPPDNFTSTLVSAVTLYVIGVTAGLFGRLYAEANRESAINDYGLSKARLQAIPIISGLAAVGGMFVVAASTLPPTNGSFELSHVFTLNIHNILVALIFGFTPNLLIKNFQKGADQYVSDLESTRKKGDTTATKNPSK
jgi:hypothetical protein